MSKAHLPSLGGRDIDNCLPSALFAVLALLLLFLLRFALVVILLCLGLFALDRFEVALVGAGGCG